MGEQPPRASVAEAAGAVDERTDDQTIEDAGPDGRPGSAPGPGTAPGVGGAPHLGRTAEPARETDPGPTIRRWTAPDGTGLAYRSLGAGRPLIVVGGFSGGREWIDHGLAAAFVAAGHRVIIPDLRGHGAGDGPHAASAYPPDVLADDGLALVSHLGLRGDDGAYDLVGYSLGGRVVLRMLVRGARPDRAVVAGQGLDATTAGSDRTDRRRRLLTAMVDGTPLGPDDRPLAEWMLARGVDPRAMLAVLDSFVPTPPDELARIDAPTLVVIGDRDPRTSAEALAAAVPGARLARVPGGHDALTGPQMLATILAFLDGPARDISRATSRS